LQPTSPSAAIARMVGIRIRVLETAGSIAGPWAPTSFDFVIRIPALTLKSSPRLSLSTQSM